MKLSAFGDKFCQESGISQLMDDIDSALSGNADMLFLGGGNPARIPAMEDIFTQRMQALTADADKLSTTLGMYQSPKGEKTFCNAVARLLHNKLGWAVNGDNIAIANGSQAAFFTLFNMFGGKTSAGVNRSIHLPLTPEYIGYTDVGVSEDFFTGSQPDIEKLDNHLFKYRVDFDGLGIDESVAALCVSRPTNPTGNVLTDDEMVQLDQLARQHNIPLIIDSAYGLPFPGIVFEQATPLWNDNVIALLSLSKLGLPGVRSGIVVASEEIIQAYVRASTIANLACANLGPAISQPWFESGEILRYSTEIVGPYYQQRALQTVDWFREALGDLPYFIHKPEGAIFLWLWFENLPVSSEELYQRLKNRNVLVIPSQNFFPGIDPAWQHTRECIRVSYARDEQTVRKAITIIAEELRAAYKNQI